MMEEETGMLEICHESIIVPGKNLTLPSCGGLRRILQ